MILAGPFQIRILCVSLVLHIPCICQSKALRHVSASCILQTGCCKTPACCVLCSQGGQQSAAPPTSAVPPACSPNPTPGLLTSAGSGTRRLFFPKDDQRIQPNPGGTAGHFGDVTGVLRSGEGEGRCHELLKKSTRPAQLKNETAKTALAIPCSRKDNCMCQVKPQEASLQVAVEPRKVQGGAEPHGLPKVRSQVSHKQRTSSSGSYKAACQSRATRAVEQPHCINMRSRHRNARGALVLSRATRKFDFSK